MSDAAPAAVPLDDKQVEALLHALKVIADGSSQLTIWALALLAGSVAVIVSTDYLRPSRRWRMMYLLFLPAWAFVGWSVYCGNVLSRRYIAAIMGRKEMLQRTQDAMNSDFICQLDKLYWGLAFFGAWLLLFLYWWIFAEERRQATKGARP